MTFYNQWLVIDGSRLSMSDGGCATMAAAPLQVTAVSTSLAKVGGSPLSLTGVNFGDPDDLCVQLAGPRGDTVLLRTRAVTSSGGVDTATVSSPPRRAPCPRGP